MTIKKLLDWIPSEDKLKLSVIQLIFGGIVGIVTSFAIFQGRVSAVPTMQQDILNLQLKAAAQDTQNTNTTKALEEVKTSQAEILKGQKALYDTIIDFLTREKKK